MLKLDSITIVLVVFYVKGVWAGQYNCIMSSHVAVVKGAGQVLVFGEDCFQSDQCRCSMHSKEQLA